MRQPDCVLLLSGGIDSTTVLAELVALGRAPHCLIFDYGQTLVKEVQVARDNAARYGAPSAVLRSCLEQLPGDCSLLQGDVSTISTGRSRNEIAAAGTPGSYVPFRNGIFLAYAVAWGESLGVEEIYCGGNGLDSGNYPDDTEDFALAMTVAARVGTSPQYRPTIRFPNARLTKAQVVANGLSLGVDYDKTWSCYKNDAAHCGQCDSCVQRQHALALAHSWRGN